MSLWVDVVKRSALALFVSAALALVVSEAAYFIAPDRLLRGPQRVEIIIPAGTADRITKGEAVPSLSPEMTFVQGDTLVVTNQDSASHQLGPVWVPPGTSGSIVLAEASQFSYACTFQPDRYQGIDVLKPVTASSRIEAALLMGIPTAVLAVMYSYIVKPVRRRPGEAAV